MLSTRFDGAERDRLKRSVLRMHPLLASCPRRVIRRVAAIADEVYFAPGDALAERHRMPKWFFLVHSGTAAIVRDGRPIGLLGPGGHYGEVPLLGRGVHPVTVRAITDMRVFVIGCQHFSPLVEDVRSLREHLEADLVEQSDLVAQARAELGRRIYAPRGAPPGSTPWVAQPRSVAWTRQLRPQPVATERQRPAKRTGLRAAAVVAAVATAVIATTQYHPPFGVVRPGPVVDIADDIVISGAPVHPVHGRYLLLTVRTERPTLLDLGGAVLRGEREIVRVDHERTASAARLDRLRGQFARSQRDATTTAATAMGVPARGSNGTTFSVRFRRRDVVGPSAGLVYALALEDLLSDVDVARGRVIAATGEIDAAGDVLAVGYVDEKARAARRAGADVLFTPVSEAYEAAGSGVRVTGVSSVKEAFARLAQD